MAPAPLGVEGSQGESRSGGTTADTDSQGGSESQWLDSVSLLIQDTLEGEMLMIDNLSGSVFHHYSSPPICKDCKGHLQEIRMAEIEQAVAEVRAAIGQVLFPRPAGRPQSGRTYRLSAANARGHGKMQQ
ncbi:hypothetical protein fugu_015435 [Takifugu bimaculatus]|uniref:Uncharacterized protein n=1 Tax=Takifugu bimaculatus TaxID=433685 RepID=A0A4Z2BYQ2_9TELE|nr:hypothetical protein fugu_015435 [Takifugu bimaculatus]